MIRVQAGRLRSKLSKYYETEGANDPIVVELPKGSYVLSFHHHGKATLKLDGNRSSEQVHQEARPTRRILNTALVALSVVLVSSIAAIARLTAFTKSSDGTLAHKDPH